MVSHVDVVAPVTSAATFKEGQRPTCFLHSSLQWHSFRRKFYQQSLFLLTSLSIVHAEILFDFLATFPRPQMYSKSLIRLPEQGQYLTDQSDQWSGRLGTQERIFKCSPCGFLMRAALQKSCNDAAQDFDFKLTFKSVSHNFLFKKLRLIHSFTSALVQCETQVWNLKPAI